MKNNLIMIFNILPHSTLFVNAFLLKFILFGILVKFDFIIYIYIDIYLNSCYNLTIITRLGEFTWQNQSGWQI